jgi:thiamine-phosphate pyrophosphorylase
MKLVVISSNDKYDNEVTLVCEMFRRGLALFHVRKPKFSRSDMESYLQAFPPMYHKRIIIHSFHDLAFKYKLAGIHLSRHHRKRGKLYFARLMITRLLNPGLMVTRSFHKLTDLGANKRVYSYVFLSPVFDSISNSTLSAGFSQRALLIMIKASRNEVLAMGGVKPKHLVLAAELGFAGVAMLGGIWNADKDPVSAFQEAHDATRNLFKTTTETLPKS